MATWGGQSFSSSCCGLPCHADVECVATGTTHNDRAVAQVAVIDQYGQVLLNLYVKPDKPVVSYLTPLTGITQGLLEQQGVSLQQALGALRQVLPRTATLVGQNILADVQWLGLQQGVDYQELVDLAGLFRILNPKYRSYSVFSQDHLSRVLLGWEPGLHSAMAGAMQSMRLWQLHGQLQADPGNWQRAQEALLASQPEPSFAKKNPSFEGVCMGNRKTCTCGAAFFG